MDSTDCGPTCIRIISSYYGRKISHYEIHRHCHISRDGISLLSINNAAKAIGFRTTCIRLSFQQLCNETKFPCIIHWNQNHFVVVYKVKSKGTKTWIYISDPAYGLLKYDKIQFIKSWISTYHESDYNTITNLGVVLLLEPTAEKYHFNTIFYNGTVDKCSNIDPSQTRGILDSKGNIQWRIPLSEYDKNLFNCKNECIDCKHLPLCMGTCPINRRKALNNKESFSCNFPHNDKYFRAAIIRYAHNITGAPYELYC